ncbi:hypothetical protein ACTXT7_014310 [Hymenolepis weldensis]
MLPANTSTTTSALDSIFTVHGFPETLVLGNGTQLCSSLFKEYFRTVDHFHTSHIITIKRPGRAICQHVYKSPTKKQEWRGRRRELSDFSSGDGGNRNKLWSHIVGTKSTPASTLLYLLLDAFKFTVNSLDKARERTTEQRYIARKSPTRSQITLNELKQINHFWKLMQIHLGNLGNLGNLVMAAQKEKEVLRIYGSKRLALGTNQKRTRGSRNHHVG